MGDLKSSLARVRFEDLNLNHIMSFTESLLREKNLELFAKSINFSYASNQSFTSLTTYNKNNKQITFNLNNLETIKIPDNIIYNHIVTMYEIYLAVEKVFIENLSNDVKYRTIVLIKQLVNQFNLDSLKYDERYYDDNDEDVKIFNCFHFCPKLDKISTISPVERYVRLQAFYETRDLISSLYTNTEELRLFCQNFIDLIYNGYVQKNNIISYPLYNYFSQRSDREGKKILKEFSWYSKDELKTLYNASSIYSERDRFIYGMPIDICEYNSIRKRV